MTNSPEKNDHEQFHGTNNPISTVKLKEYGKKAFTPLVDVVFKYQDEFTPYFNALIKGLEGGAQRLSAEGSSDAEKYVSHLFSEAGKGLSQVSQKIDSKDINGITVFLQEQMQKSPSVMFSASYVVGILFGRLGRHIARQRILTNEPPTQDETIH